MPQRGIQGNCIRGWRAWDRDTVEQPGDYVQEYPEGEKKRDKTVDHGDDPLTALPVGRDEQSPQRRTAVPAIHTITSAASPLTP